MKIKNIKRRISAVLAAVCMVFSLPIASEAAVTAHQQLDYADSLETINNPDRGFYRPIGIM